MSAAQWCPTPAIEHVLAPARAMADELEALVEHDPPLLRETALRAAVIAIAFRLHVATVLVELGARP